ncbi:hypothetical protein DJ64_24610 [Streptomyces griseorubens]|uniref:Uncharacterized protein n=1 Tax=Streptomyces griseorubens TaxID=66897 RepID=A0ABR4SS89_9ACTN|nr:hypothetical protein DJ64_24610 [Streptomyces griseorubens]
MEQHMSARVRVVRGDHVDGEPVFEASVQPVGGPVRGLGGDECHQAGGVVAGRERHAAADRVEFGGVQWVGEGDFQGVVGHLSPPDWYQSMRLPQLRQRPIWPARGRRLVLCAAICRERRGGR